MSKYFSLYSFSIPIRGKDHAVICDLQNSSYTDIPLFLFELLEQYPELSLKELEELYNDKGHYIFKYLTLLEKRNIGRFSLLPNEFCKINLTWKKAEQIRTAVIDVADQQKINYLDLFDQLNDLNCRNIEMRFFRPISQHFLEEILLHTKTSKIRTIDFILPFDAGQIDIKKYRKNTQQYKKLCHTIFYGTDLKISYKDDCIFSSLKDLSSPAAFEDVAEDQYIINTSFFSEAQKFNTYYNAKVCIDVDGNLKNCSSHTNHFGSIREAKLKDLIDQPDFKRFWNISNDQILGIQDSALRYIWMNTHDLEQVDDTLYKMKYVQK